jgi:hypothetical protein
MNIDTAYFDRQDLINNLPAVPVLAAPEKVDTRGEQFRAKPNGEARESTGTQTGTDFSSRADSRGGRQSNLPDTWEAIAAQLDHWADMDAFYWTQRKEKAYADWMERTYGLPTA